jgi:uncharacterized protein YbjQ (UPF0145 family)
MSYYDPTKYAKDDIDTAKRIVRKKIEQGCKFIVGPNVYAEELVKEILQSITDAYDRGYTDGFDGKPR